MVSLSEVERSWFAAERTVAGVVMKRSRGVSERLFGRDGVETRFDFCNRTVELAVFFYGGLVWKQPVLGVGFLKGGGDLCVRRFEEGAELGGGRCRGVVRGIHSRARSQVLVPRNVVVTRVFSPGNS